MCFTLPPHKSSIWYTIGNSVHIYNKIYCDITTLRNSIQIHPCLKKNVLERAYIKSPAGQVGGVRQWKLQGRYFFQGLSYKILFSFFCSVFCRFPLFLRVWRGKGNSAMADLFLDAIWGVKWRRFLFQLRLRSQERGEHTINLLMWCKLNCHYSETGAL